MKPVSPEDRPMVEWVRKCLQSGRADVQPKKAIATKNAEEQAALSG